MRHNIWRLAVVCGLSMNHLGFAAPAAETGFETPKAIEADVAFWENIFSIYKPSQCVFHDSDDLRIIYLVAPVPFDARGSKKTIAKHVRAIRKDLEQLAWGSRPQTAAQKKIWQALPEEVRRPSFFKTAGERIRCQRGVDLAASVKRSKPYLTMIRGILATKGLPEDLAYLPHLESGFQAHAHSRAGARGLWQLTRAVAISEGLKVKRYVDARLDVRASTEAATDHLASLYLRTRSWPLAITAYNYGPNGTARAIERFGGDYIKIRDEHRTSMFGFAARNYFPSFLAARNVARTFEARFGARKKEKDMLASSDTE